MTWRQWVAGAWPAAVRRETAIPRARSQSFRAVALFALVALDFSYGLRLARVQGHSMEPTFQPGQWLLVRRLNWPSPPLRVGEVIGDNLSVSEDSRTFGPIPQSSVLGRVLAWQEDPDRPAPPFLPIFPRP